MNGVNSAIVHVMSGGCGGDVRCAHGTCPRVGATTCSAHAKEYVYNLADDAITLITNYKG